MSRLVAQRRSRLVDRHLLDGSATSPLEAARSVVVLHATDPATVYLSVLVRCQAASLGDVAGALYVERSLVRMMAMRRTLFVVPSELAPVVHAAASLDVAATMRRRLLTQLSTMPTDPELPRDAGALQAWLEGVEAGVEDAVGRLRIASGAQLAAAEPRLGTALLPTTTKTYDVRRSITSQVLALMGAEGRLVRRQPLGAWTSRQHTWEPASEVWPEGIPAVDRGTARAALVAAYLRRFGPASETDVAWWTGWPLRETRAAVAAAGAQRVDGLLDLTGGSERGRQDAAATDGRAGPRSVATLLPALDPTPMGWKERDWFLPEDPSVIAALYDSNGNIGPTVWWAGEVVGGWAVRPDGSVVTRMLVDRGAEVERAVGHAAEALHARLEGAVVVPSFRTPLERDLSRP